MNKKELIRYVSYATGHTQRETALIVDAVFAEIAEALAAGDKVQLTGFGTFSLRERAARTGKNPKTGEAIQVQACKVPVFKAGNGLWKSVNR